MLPEYIDLQVVPDRLLFSINSWLYDWKFGIKILL